jgi:hypothetical protein
MTTLPTQHIPKTRHILLNVADYMEDGASVDSSEPLTIGGVPTGLQVTVGDVNLGTTPPTFTANAPTGRWVKIKMVDQVSGDVNIFAPGVPSEGILKQPVIGDPQPNDSRIDLVQILGPYKD